MAGGVHGHLAIQKNQRSYVMNDPYAGTPYKDEEVHAAANKIPVRLQAMSRRSEDIYGETARLLAQGHVFGWFQRRSEFGLRALGNRSILADRARPRLTPWHRLPEYIGTQQRDDHGQAH